MEFLNLPALHHPRHRSAIYHGSGAIYQRTAKPTADEASCPLDEFGYRPVSRAKH